MDRARKRLGLALLAAAAAIVLLWTARTFFTDASDDVVASVERTESDADTTLEKGSSSSQREVLDAAFAGASDDLVPADEEEHHTDLVVVDASHRAIGGARVSWIHDAVAHDLGATGDDGRLRLHPTNDWLEGDALVASKVGLASREHFVAFPLGDEVRIVLAEDALITGTVRAAPGIREAPGEITVVGVPLSMTTVVRCEDCRAWLDDPRVLVTRCDRDGAFALTGAAPGRKYAVEAGCSGWILVGPGVGTQVGERPIDLFVTPLFGARLHLISADGAPIARVPAPFPAWGIQARCDSSDVSAAEASWLAQVLAGVPDEWRTESPDHVAYLYTSTRSALSVGPLHVHAKLYGYQAKDIDVQLARFIAPPSDVTLALHPTAVGFGSIDLAFESMPPASVEGPGVLVLRSSSGERSIYGTRELNGTHARIGPLPVDRYDWRFEWSPRTPARVRSDVPWSHVNIVKDAIVPLAVPNEPSGSLSIELVDEQRARYTGPARFFVGETDDAPRVPGGVQVPGSQVMTGDGVRFSRAPYRIAGLQPGAIEMRVTAPLPAKPGSIRFTIVAGENQRVVIPIRSYP
jgi:hypothetical protein